MNRSTDPRSDESSDDSPRCPIPLDNRGGIARPAPSQSNQLVLLEFSETIGTLEVSITNGLPIDMVGIENRLNEVRSDLDDEAMRHRLAKPHEGWKHVLAK